MKKNFGLIGLGLTLLLGLSGCAQGTLEGKNVEGIESITAQTRPEEKPAEGVKDVPSRTVAGTVAVLDMLDYLDIEMVGRPETERPLEEKFASIPSVGKPMTPDMELLKSIDPDMYISVTSLSGDLKSNIEAQNIKTLFLDNSSYASMLASMEILGDMYGKEDLAKGYVDEIEEKSKLIKEKVAGKESPRVMILFGSPKSIMFATEKSFVGSLVKELGAINVVNELGDFEDNYAPISMEHLMGLEPDIILRLTHASPDQARKMFNDEFERSDIWPELKAVQEGKVYDLDNNYFGVSGNIRILEAFTALEEMLFQ